MFDETKKNPKCPKVNEHKYKKLIVGYTNLFDVLISFKNPEIHYFQK